jgi:hypothetical protein
MKKYLPIVMASLLLPAAAFSAEKASTIDDQKSVEVTVYNSNIGLVKDTRSLNLKTGQGELRFMDVASGILPYTVHVKSADSGLTVLEQNYEYDLIDHKKLLDKYVGKEIKLLKVNEYQGSQETTKATLLSNNNGEVYEIDGEIHLGSPGYKILPSIPDNLIAKPTLTWMYDNKMAGAQDVEVSYLTNNISWKADYVLVVDKDDAKGNLSGWVTLDNRSGASYNNAKLKLVAGQVNRVQPQMYRQEVMMKSAMAMDAAAPAFQEQSFFEYHLYDLQRATTVKDNQTKQVSLLEAENIKINKEYSVRGDTNWFYSGFGTGHDPIKTPVNVVLKFKNAKDNNLGMPLPAGVIRLYKEDEQKSLQFAGEDSIGHTPKDEDVEMKVGEAFDVVAERKQIDYQVNGNVYETEWEISVRNHKEIPIKISVIEPAPGDWVVANSTHQYVKTSSSSIKFDVDVPKDGEIIIKYRVRVRVR